MAKSSAYKKRLMKRLRELAKGKCSYSDFRYRPTKAGPDTCLCGKTGLRDKFMIQHTKNKSVSGIVGSTCVKSFHPKGYQSLKKFFSASKK